MVRFLTAYIQPVVSLGDGISGAAYGDLVEAAALESAIRRVFAQRAAIVKTSVTDRKFRSRYAERTSGPARGRGTGAAASLEDI